ncbi:FAD-binding oxidoreductase [Saccharopolyspora sp. NPDC002686]|uniref:NAD(P)/FAD-dependent oxidoreductase n=1 Tax=Saccharopolyspora sp. NPDC002686 TaxID=3154541 RepID=UPI0033277C3B
MAIDGITYSSFSGWIDPPGEVLPAFEGELACDVAVVGGGYAGMAAALRLAERGADVALFEAGFCGVGASSRNAGHLSGAPPGDPRLLGALQPHRLRGIVQFSQEAVRFTEELLQRLAIDSDYEPTGNVEAAVSRGQIQKVRRTAQILHKAGSEAEFGSGRDLGLPGTFLAGLFEPLGGLLNPGKFALGLREALLESGARVFERTPVRTVEPTSAGVVVNVPGGHVRAERVVLATNAYSRELAVAPKRLANPVWVRMVETDPIDSARLEATGWRSRSGIVTKHNIMESYRLTPRGTIVFGVRRLSAGRGALESRTPDPAAVADLARGFRTRFPSLRDVALDRTWGGWIAMTSPWLPVAGEATKNVSYLIGCNGHGLAQAPYLGTLLADRLAGDELHDDLGTVWRVQPRFAPSLFCSPLTLRTMWAIDRLSDRLHSSKR